MHLLHYFSVMGALLSPCFAYNISWDGSQPRCRNSHKRIQSIYDIVTPAMSRVPRSSRKAKASRTRTLERTVYPPFHWGYCAWIGNGGGNAFDKAKILSMLDFSPAAAKFRRIVRIRTRRLSAAQQFPQVVDCEPMSGRFPASVIAPTNQDKQGTLANNDRGYAPGTCELSFMQYQGFTGASDAPAFIDASQTATTYMDVQILDANGLLVGGTWYQESLSGETWDLPSQLPAMLLVGSGAVQSDAINFAYNGGEFSAVSSQCSSSGNFKNGVRSGSCDFPLLKRILSFHQSLSRSRGVATCSDVVFNTRKEWGSMYILQILDWVYRGSMLLNLDCIHRRLFS